MFENNVNDSKKSVRLKTLSSLIKVDQSIPYYERQHYENQMCRGYIGPGACAPGDLSKQQKKQQS